MKIAIIGPGEIEIPPSGWGAVEEIIHQYYLELCDLGHDVLVVNTKDTKKIISDVNKFKPDFVHCQYDNFINVLKKIHCPFKAITSHYGYLNQVWSSDEDYLLKIHKSIISAKDVLIFALSNDLAKRYISDGVNPARVFVVPNGVCFKNFKRKNKPRFPNKSIYLAKIDSRKRQGSFQNIKANIFFAGNLCNYTAVKSGFDSSQSNYLGEWTKQDVFANLTDYANLILLSDGEAHPLVCMEALAAGLGLVVSECATANLDLKKKFIDVIPESKISDYKYIKEVIAKNRKTSILKRKEIIAYAKKFRWELVVNVYMKTISKIISSNFKLENKINVGVVTIATGQYHNIFIPELKKSVDKHFVFPATHVNFYCFSDTKKYLRGVRYFESPFLGWPFDTLMRYQLFLNKIDLLMKNDVIIYVDADTKFIKNINSDLLKKNLFALPHIGFFSYQGTFEIDPSEISYVSPEDRKNYVHGCFWGGQNIEFKKMIITLALQTSYDLTRSKIPVWHDESYLNKYLSKKDYFLLPKSFSKIEGESNSLATLVHLNKNNQIVRSADKTNNFINSQSYIRGISNHEKFMFFKNLYLNAHAKNQYLEGEIIKKSYILSVRSLNKYSVSEIMKTYDIRAVFIFLFNYIKMTLKVAIKKIL